MKAIYIILGFISLMLGIIGAFLPLLPTTPFLLLTVFCFAQGSERLHNWIIQTELYKKHLQSFSEQRALTLKTKIRILILSTTMLAIGFYFTPTMFGKVAILLGLLIHYWVFFFWIKTLKE
ncbi:YbaN family protein [Avibacterium endocarditidis]|uniref:YbaN family protein n=1 Tax=Avibacterium TaxID=292486 RepID=UPI0039FDD8C0